MTGKNIKLAALLAVASALAACGGPKTLKTTPPPVATPAAEIDQVFDLLMAGDEGGATKRLKAIRKREPMNANAQLLSDSITRDPKELLGPSSYVYTVRSGDTIVGLAQRFLGNRLKAYQLLRYNGLKAPAVLTPGQMLRIPGEAARPEPIRQPEPAPRPAPATKPKPAAAKPTAPAAPAAVPAANPAAARQARAAGLAALNQGNVARAVQLLRRAAALDPGNPAIARDLSRAERIAATVRARK